MNEIQLTDHGNFLYGVYKTRSVQSTGGMISEKWIGEDVA